MLDYGYFNFDINFIFKRFLILFLKRLINEQILFVFQFKLHLTLSWPRPISYRNQSIDLQSKSMDWLLYDIGLRHEKVKFLKRLSKTNDFNGSFVGVKLIANSMPSIMIHFSSNSWFLVLKLPYTVSEAVAQRCFVKRLFLKNFRNSTEMICARLPGL